MPGNWVQSTRLVIAVHGDVSYWHVNGQSIAVNSNLRVEEGGRLVTGVQSSVVIELQNGSRLELLPESQVQLSRLRA